MDIVAPRNGDGDFRQVLLLIFREDDDRDGKAPEIAHAPEMD